MVASMIIFVVMPRTRWAGSTVEPGCVGDEHQVPLRPETDRDCPHHLLKVERVDIIIHHDDELRIDDPVGRGEKAQGEGFAQIPRKRIFDEMIVT